MNDFVFPLDESGHVAADAKFRVLYPALCYGDLAPLEVQGQVFALRGEVITFYPELRAYPERIKLLCDLRRIEYVSPPQEYQPKTKVKTIAKSDEKEEIE